MFEEKKVFITGGTGSIGNSICHYFFKNKCKEIFASTTNLKKINAKDTATNKSMKKIEFINFVNFSIQKKILLLLKNLNIRI